MNEPCETTRQAALVLIVDDSPIARRKLELAARALGHRADAVPDGDTALQRLREARHDLVLLDIVMPGMDGYAVLQRIKADPDLAHVPVIIVSSLEGEVGHVAHAIELGAEDCLPPHFHPQIFNARVRSCLERKWQRDRELADQNDIDRLVEASQIIESGAFRPADLALRGVAARGDALGNLAKVFTTLAQQVYDRERRYDHSLRTLRGTLLVIAAGAVFGIGPALGRLSSAYALPPLGVVFWANVVAAVACLLHAVTRPVLPRLTRHDIRFLAAWALVLGCLYQPLTVIVAGHVEATTIALIGSSRGFLVFLMAAALALEAPSLRRFLGLGVGFVAIALVLLSDGKHTGSAPPAWVLSAIALPALLAVHTLLMSWRRAELPADLAVGVMMAVSALVLLPIAMRFDALFPPWVVPNAAVTIILTLGLGTAVALVLGLNLVSLAGPVFASQMAYSQTLAGIAWGILLLGESPSPLALSALIVVIGGFWLVAPRPAGEEFRASARHINLRRRSC